MSYGIVDDLSLTLVVLFWPQSEELKAEKNEYLSK